MLYENIVDQSVGLNQACETLGVSKTGYLAWKQRPPALPDALVEPIQRIAEQYPRYGYRRITHELKRQGTIANHKRVLKTMKENGLLVKKRCRFKPQTTNSNHGFPVYANLAEGLTVTRLNQVWVSDITYVWLKNGFVYLAVVMDVFSRKVVGWQLSRTVDAHLCLDALERAVASRSGVSLAGLIHHSDRGVQYACHAYTQRLQELGFLISMSRVGNPYDNAFAESVIKTIKYEEVYLTEYDSFLDAYQNIGQFIEDVYNEKRLHSAIGYLPPTEFEQKILKEVSA